VVSEVESDRLSPQNQTRRGFQKKRQGGVREAGGGKGWGGLEEGVERKKEWEGSRGREGGEGEVL
jgi:hypothetical protein